jgi:hypothetical protein
MEREECRGRVLLKPSGGRADPSDSGIERIFAIIYVYS